ncbi:MAG: helix-turn-helix domain-containing protein [Planctomycetota bacterium]|nr:helix-turn-helix domain-containing protein [Planctomycetota bacterium]
MDREKRAKAAELFARGSTRAEVARQLGIPRATAGRWYRLWSAGGSLTEERRGRPPRLSARARAELGVVLHDSPRAHGFDLGQWSQDAVVALIEQRFGVRYHPRHVGRLLRQSGWLLPPVGATAKAGVRTVPFADPDGTPLALQAWRRGGERETPT